MYTDMKKGESDFQKPITRLRGFWVVKQRGSRGALIIIRYSAILEPFRPVTMAPRMRC